MIASISTICLSVAAIAGQRRYLAFQQAARLGHFERAVGLVGGNRLRRGLGGDIDARAVPALHQPAQFQHDDRLAHHRPADAEFLGQFALGGQAPAGL